MAKPYTFKKGDSLEKIAKSFKIADPTKIWRFDKNKDLVKQRKTPKALEAGDVLQIPSESELKKIAPDPARLKEIEKELLKQKDRALAELRKGVLRKSESMVSSSVSMWKSFKKNREDQWFVGPICELVGGVSLPSASLANAAVNAVKALRAAIDKGDFKAVQRALKAMEKPVNDFTQAVDDYYQGIVGGASRAITGLKVAKGAGFIAIGVLATTFTGGAAAAAMGIEGTLVGSSVAAGIGGGIGGTVDAVATGLGRGMAGVNMNWGQLAAKPIKGALAGAILQGPMANTAGKLVPKKMAEVVFKSGLGKGEKIAAVVARLGVAPARKAIADAIEDWWKSSPKSEIDKIESAVYKRASGKASQDQIAQIIAEELARSGALQKALKKVEDAK